MPNIQPTKTDKFAVFDIDGTLIRWQLYHELVDRLARAGALGQDAPLTLKHAQMSWKRRDQASTFKDYDDILVQVYEDAIQNVSVELFDKLVIEVIEEYKDQSYAYTRSLLRKLKSEGYKLFIISGSHTELIEQIGKYYGFDDWVGTHYERGESGFTGRVQVSTLDKEKSLRVLLSRNDVTLDGSIGIGDTASDIPMLKVVENPIAFNPDKQLLETAKASGWKIVLERKNVVYELKSDHGQYVLAETDS